MKKVLSILLTTLLFLLIATPASIFAEGNNITANDYSVQQSDEDERPKVILDGSTSSYDNVVVPSECCLVILGDVSINTLTLKEGSFLEIFNENSSVGKLTVTNMNVEEMASMTLASQDNIPKIGADPIALYDAAGEPLSSITSEINFVYYGEGDPVVKKWRHFYDIDTSAYVSNNLTLSNGRYANVIVPNGYTLTIDGAVTFDSIALEENSLLKIIGNGWLESFSYEINEGARIYLEKTDNLPIIEGEPAEFYDFDGGVIDTEPGTDLNTLFEVGNNGDVSQVLVYDYDVSPTYSVNQDITVGNSKCMEIKGASVTFAAGKKLTLKENSKLIIKDSGANTGNLTISSDDLIVEDNATLVLETIDDKPSNFVLKSYNPVTNKYDDYTDTRTNQTFIYSDHYDFWIHKEYSENDCLQLKNSLYDLAYGDMDADNDVDDDDILLGAANAIYDLVNGQCQGCWEMLGLTENQEKNSAITDIKSKLSIVKSYETDSADYTRIVAKNAAGNDEVLDAYVLELNIDDLNNLRFAVYKLKDTDGSTHDSAYKFIIRIYEMGDTPGIKYYVRRSSYDSDSDETSFELFGTSNYISGTNAINIFTNDSIVNKNYISIFGNGAKFNDEVLTDGTFNKVYVENYNSSLDRFGGKLAVYSKDFLGINLETAGGTQYPLAWDVNTMYPVVETDENSETSVYFGYSMVKIYPIEIAGTNANDITKVEVTPVDETLIDNGAISIEDKTDYVQIEFLSNYYDSIKLNIKYTYSDTTTQTKQVIINRVGIVIDDEYSAGDEKTKVCCWHGHETNKIDIGENHEYAIYATYYYPEEKTAGDVSLFVTLTYSDGSVEKKLLTQSSFTPTNTTSGHEANAMSDYIIWYGMSDEDAPIKVEAIAVENVGADGFFAGAKLGAGKGVTKTFGGY